MEIESTSHSITAEKPTLQYGWVCPLCGRANAPFVRSCDCAGIPNTILGDRLVGYKYNFNTGETANDFPTSSKDSLAKK